MSLQGFKTLLFGAVSEILPFHIVRPPVESGSTRETYEQGTAPYPDSLIESERRDHAQLLEYHSWVLACVRAISHAVSTTPLVAQTQSGKGTWERLPRSIPLVRALEDVNEYQSQQDLLEATSSFMALQGKAYWELARDGKGQIARIYTMHPSYVTPQPGKNGEYVRGYKYQSPLTGIRYFDPKDVMFFRFFHPHNDYDGLSPLQAVREGILTDFSAQQYNKRFFQNDATPRGVLETDRSLSKRAVERLRGLWQSLYGGTGNAHRTAILEEGLKYKMVSITPRDMEFLRLRKFTREEIMAVFGVYPVVLGLMEGATYANASAQKQLFYEHTVGLYLRKIEDQLTFLLQQEQQDPRARVRFDISQVAALRPAVSEVVEWGTKAVGAGILTINDVRALISYKPVPWGDTWWGNQAMVPLADGSGTINLPANSDPALPKGSVFQELKKEMAADGDIVSLEVYKQKQLFLAQVNDTLSQLQDRLDGAQR